MAPDAPTPDPSPAEPAFWSLPSGPQIAHWFIEQFRAGTFQNPGGDATLLSDNPICSVWLLATVDHDEQMFHLLDIHTGESHDLLFVTHGLRESFGCEWRQEPTDVLPWGADALVWFSERIEFAEEASGIPLVWSYTDGSCGPTPDPSPDTPSICPNCESEDVGDAASGNGYVCYRCSHAFDPPTAPGSSSPDTDALNDWNTPMTPHPDTELMLPRDPAATVDKAYDERDAWVETARMYAQNSDYWRDRFHDLRHNLGIRAFTAPDEDENVMLAALDARIMSALADAERLKTALRLTAEYVGPELLPPIEGWSWYDALEQS